MSSTSLRKLKVNCSSVYLSLHAYHLSDCLSVCLQTCPFFTFCRSVSQTVCLSVCLPLCLSTFMPDCLFFLYIYIPTRHERYCDRKEKERDGTGRNGTVTGLNGTVKSCKIPLYPAHKWWTVLSNTDPKWWWTVFIIQTRSLWMAIYTP
jgi:hypothetical protein